MLNSGLKKDAISKYENAVRDHEELSTEIVGKSEELFNERKKLKDEIVNTWNTLNKIKNTPVEFDAQLDEIHFKFNRYDEFVKEIKKEIQKNLKTSAGGAGAGLAAGAGVAFFWS